MNALINKELLHKEYVENKLSTISIGNKYGYCSAWIRKLLIKYNISRRINTEHLRQYSCNEKYFQTLSNNAAYILGFILGDGFIYQKNENYKLGIYIKKRDIEILEFIKKELKSNHPIKQNKRDFIYLNIFSNNLCYDLINIYQIIPKKTGYETFPNIDKSLYWHWLRGLTDADGCIGIYRENYTGKKTISVYQRLCYTLVSASNKLLLDINERIFENKCCIQKYKTYSRLTSKDYNIVMNICNKLYNNNDFALSRKKNIFEEMLKTNKLSC